MKCWFQFLFVLLSYTVWAQNGDQDTLIYAQGKVFNSSTKEPIEARISYQSLPYASKIGSLSGSSFRFPLFDDERYSITVEAPGYAPAKYMLDPAEANTERLVIQDIELTLPGSAAQVAESAHTVGRVMRLENLIFDVGRSRVSQESFPELNSVVKMLEDNPLMVIQLEGHTDYLGDPKANMKLSQDRVGAVKDYLVSQGISKSKVRTKAFGGTQPLSHENTTEAHTLNRRVEVRILQN